VKEVLQNIDELIIPNPLEDIQFFSRGVVKSSLKIGKLGKEQWKGALAELEDCTNKLEGVLQRCGDAIENETKKKEFLDVSKATTAFIKQLIQLCAGGDDSQQQAVSALGKKMKTVLTLAQTVFGDRVSTV